MESFILGALSSICPQAVLEKGGITLVQPVEFFIEAFWETVVQGRPDTPTISEPHSPSWSMRRGARYVHRRSYSFGGRSSPMV
jgi:hypothetical protein